MSYSEHKRKKLDTISTADMEAELDRREKTNNPFPLDVFHDNLKPMIQALVQHYDLPPSYVGLTLLSAYSTAIGSRYVVSTNGVDKMYLPVWACMVGAPNSGKSLTFKKIFTPLEEIQSEYEVDNIERTMGMTDEKIKYVDKKWVLFRDVHMATLIKRILIPNPKGVLKDADEILEWINGMNLLSNKEGTDEQVWISSWDSKKYSKLLGDNKELTIPRPFMNVFGGIQPTLMWKLFKNDRDTSGFIFRLLFALPQRIKIAEPDPTYVMDPAFEEPHRLAIRKLHNSLPVERDEFGIPEDPDVCLLHPYAVQSFREWYLMKSRLVNRVEDEKDRTVQSGIYGKIKTYCQRFAAILHLMDKALDPHYSEKDAFMLFRPEEIVEQGTMDRAIKLADYFFTSAVEAYKGVDSSVTAPEEVLRLATLFHTGRSYKRIAGDMWGDEQASEAGRKKVQRLVDKYRKLYPKVFRSDAR